MSTLKELPRTGMLTRPQFLPFTGYKSKDSITNLIEKGLFPAGYPICQNKRVWRAEDIWEWLDSRFPRQEWQNRKVRT